MIRSLWAYLVAGVVTPLLSLVVILGSLFGMRQAGYDRIGRVWCTILLRAAGIWPLVEGLDRMPRDRPVVITANHRSWVDVGCLAVAIPQRYRFVAKRELQQVPLWGRAWRAAGHIAIDRSDTQAAIRSLQNAAELVGRDNSAIVIFPEGTRSNTDELLPFRKGAFRLAISLGVAIVPVAIIGTGAVLPRSSWRIRKGEIIVRFGEPIPTTGWREDRTEELMVRVRDAIERLRRASPQANTGGHAGDHEYTRA